MILLENNIIKDSIEDGDQLHNLYKHSNYYFALQSTRDTIFDNFFENSGQSPAYTTLVKYYDILYAMSWKFVRMDALSNKKSLRRISIRACNCPFKWLTTFTDHYRGMRDISKMKRRRKCT